MKCELSTSLSAACQRLSEQIIVNLSILKTISWCLEKHYFFKIFKIVFKGGNIFDWRELEGKNFCQKYTRSFFIFVEFYTNPVLILYILSAVVNGWLEPNMMKGKLNTDFSWSRDRVSKLYKTGLSRQGVKETDASTSCSILMRRIHQ